MLKETWSKPEVIEQQIGLEATGYAPAEIEAAWARWRCARRDRHRAEHFAFASRSQISFLGWPRTVALTRSGLPTRPPN